MGIGFRLEGWRDRVSVTSISEKVSERTERQPHQVLPFAIKIVLAILLQFGCTRLPVGAGLGGVGLRVYDVGEDNA